LRYESNGFGYHHHHNQFMSPESYGRQYHGNFMESSINKLYSQVEAHDNQRFSANDLHPQNFGDAFLGAENAGTTLQSLMESFGSFDLEQPHPQQQPSYNGWPAPAPQMPAPAPMIQPQMSAQAPMMSAPDLGTKSPMKFPSQILTQNSRASPFSDTTESSLFSSCSNLSRLDLPPTSTFSNFSTSSLMSSQSTQNSLGLSDISSRLEGLSQGSLVMSQTCSTRDSTPLSWNPIANFSSKTNSLTSSPIMSGHKNITRPEPPALFSDEEEDLNLVKVIKNTSPPHVMAHDKIRNLAKPKLHKSMSTSCVPEPAPGPSGAASWSQIVRTSSSKLPQVPQVPAPITSPLASPRVTRASLNTPSPTPVVKEEQARLVVEEVPPTTNTVDFHRGPKVDPRWPVTQQVFLGPIPMSITWDEIRNVFYTKVQRRELLHFYVQSKPVNEVVYGQVVFDKVSLAAKVVKDGPVKVRGHLINVTLMKEKVKAEKKK